MKKFYIDDLKIHTIELTHDIAINDYKNLLDYFYSANKRIMQENNIKNYLGFINKGFQIKLCAFNEPCCYQIKYIINPARFYDNNNYLELSDINSITETLKSMSGFLISNYKGFPPLLNCRITRIDLTKDIYVGENIGYIIKLLNRCYIPETFSKYKLKNGNYPKDNATFTKRSKSGGKIFELSFYNKYSEMKAHTENSKYCYDANTLQRANGILRMELRLYSRRLNNMKKSLHFNTASELLSNLPEIVYRITYKNFRSLFMIGKFYKSDEIKQKISESGYHEKTKCMMLMFIDSVMIHKNAELAAFDFEEKYGEKKLKIVLNNFNELRIIPTPIAVKKKMDEWEFIS